MILIKRPADVADDPHPSPVAMLQHWSSSPIFQLEFAISRPLTYPISFLSILLTSVGPAMSFGFSVGDFLAVGKLVADITNSLREAGGSKSEYQELLQELESLNHALKHLDKLPTKDNSANLQSIKLSAASRTILGEYREI